MNTAVQIVPGRITTPVTHYLAVPDQAAAARSVMELVANYYGFGVRDLLGRCKTKHVAYARQMAMTMVRRHTALSLQETADVFTRTYQAICHACAKMETWKMMYKQTRRDFEALDSMLSLNAVGRIIT